MSTKDRTLLRVGVEGGRCLLEVTEMGPLLEVYCRNPIWQSGSEGEVKVRTDTMRIDPTWSVGVSKAFRACQGNGKVGEFDLYGPEHIVSVSLMQKNPLYWLTLTPCKSTHNAEPFYYLLHGKDMQRLKRIFS